MWWGPQSVAALQCRATPGVFGVWSLMLLVGAGWVAVLCVRERGAAQWESKHARSASLRADGACASAFPAGSFLTRGKSVLPQGGVATLGRVPWECEQLCTLLGFICFSS
jgi:hypothetical protein